MAKPTQPDNRERLAYHRSRCQAHFRRQEWAPEFTYEEWWRLWRDLWPRRGRGSRDFCMIRVNEDLPWHQDNVDVCERREYLTAQGRYWRGGRWRNT